MNIIPHVKSLAYNPASGDWIPPKAGQLPLNPLERHEFLRSREDIHYELTDTEDSPEESPLSKGKHRILIESTGVIVQAEDQAGLFWASQSLSRIIKQTEGIEKGTVKALEIKDESRFSWRGFMLDTSRFFQPVERILEIIDILAGLKFNILHLHLTDDQGWRLEIPAYPLLTKIGSRRKRSLQVRRGQYKDEPHEGYYNREDIQRIVEYASARFITIIPEIDLPGHSVAALASYPELGCTGGPYEVRVDSGISRDILCMGSASTEPFIREVLSTVSDLFPGPWVHIGGDEVPKKRWRSCPRCNSFRKKKGLGTAASQQTWLANRCVEILKDFNRKAIVWSELCSKELEDTITGQYWLPRKKTAYREARRGRKMIFSALPFSYFDMSHGFVTLKRSHDFDPLKGRQYKDLLMDSTMGIEAALWTEWLPDRERLYRRLFPRLLAYAEAAWTEPDSRDYSRFLSCLDDLIGELQAAGFPSADREYWKPGILMRIKALLMWVFDLGMSEGESKGRE